MVTRFTILTLLSLEVNLLFHSVSSENVLFLLPLATKSHKILFEPLINGMAEKGHHVSVLTNQKSPPDTLLHPRVKEFVTDPSDEFSNDFQEPLQSHRNISQKTSGMTFPLYAVVERCHQVVQSAAFQETLGVKVASRQRKFDLIFVDSFLTNCFDGFIYKSRSPFILVTSMPAPSYISERVGNFLPPSFVPVLSFRGYYHADGQMGYFARLGNFLHFLMARIYVYSVILPNLEKVYKGYLGEDTPGILEIEENASMIFMNSHFSMNMPRPLLPSVTEIGGIHCRTAVALSNGDLLNFVSKLEAPHGFIYFSVGSLINVNNAPEGFLNSLMSAFSRLKQRVVMKWKMEKPKFMNVTIPNNVWIQDWFPQQDILGHENIRLFISHGGLLSMQESVFHAVPVLGIPFGIDQDTNVHNAVLQGYGLRLAVSELSDETLYASISQMLDNPTFSENVHRISKVFRDGRPSSPLDTAVYWAEFVMRSEQNNASSFIQSPARKMNMCQYYSCDIFFTLLALLVTLCFILIFLGRRVWRVTTKLVIRFHKRVTSENLDKKWN